MPALRRSALVAFGLVLACAPHGEPAAPASPTLRPEPTAPPAESATVESTAEPAPAAAPLALGWSGDLREQPKPARQRNADALKLHRKGDYTASLAGFDAAIAIAPDFAIAHFNRACALSRLGRIADAAAVMRRLLRLDLLAFGPRLDDDADLAALRASPEAAGLAALRSELVGQYAAAVTRGIPVQIYERHWETEGAGMALGTHKQRAGVWLSDTGTFVPVTPEVEASFGLVWSTDTATVTILRGPLMHLYWQFMPSEFTVDVYDLKRPGTRLRSHSGVVASVAKLFPKAVEVEWEMYFQKLGVRPLPDRTQIEAHPYTKGKTLRLELGGPAPVVVEQAPTTGWRHDVRVLEGVLVEGLPAGYARKKSALTVPGRDAPIDLGKLYAWTQIVPAADNSAAFVLTQDAGCDGRRHRLLRLDLQSYELRELSSGRTAGTLTLAFDGGLYFQLGETTRRLAPDGALTDAGLPAWLHLAYPIDKTDCTL